MSEPLGPATFVGAGSWGTVAASLVATKGIETRLWARRPELAARIREEGRNPDYSNSLTLPPALVACADLAESVAGARLVVMAVPSHAFRGVFEELAPSLAEGVVVVSLTKGIEQGSLKRMTEVALEVAPALDESRVGVLTGPNLAGEIAVGQPSASVVAMRDTVAAEAVQAAFMSPVFRVYTNQDVVGSELGGALKNVMAIAAGVIEGLGFGDNTKAALITRGLAELARLGVWLGGEPLTFSGLAGMGDLIATCSSKLSRNRLVGEELGRGRPIGEITGEMKMVAEGVKSVQAVCDLAAREGIEMPISEEVRAIIYEGKDPRTALMDLMTRKARPELYGV